MTTLTSIPDEFTDIAPYPASELIARIESLCEDPELLDAACALRFKSHSGLFAAILRPFIRSRLKREVAQITNRREWHRFLAGYIERVLTDTSDGFTCSGIDAIPRDQPSLFVSNHRDIALDPVLVNYALWLHDMPTCKIAIGDNLMDMQAGAEFMRINDSFIVVRNAKGLKAQYAAMNKTSRYIRYVLDEGQSVWIAQREGRAKDGIDQTDPAVLKMFALAYREESKEFSYMLERINLIPTTFTYELDPCAPLKAQELAAIERTGTYTKTEHEDRDSVVQGITGFKGRIHVAFGEPVASSYQDADELARAIDEVMIENRRKYPIFEVAKDLLAGVAAQSLAGRLDEEFEAQWQSMEDRERELLLQQYANQAPQEGGLSE